ncbi:hypothetical protein Tco_1577732 [Tanacetum coccineum]
MRMEQYLQCIDYTLWEIIENGNAPIVTKIVDGKETVIPLTSVKEKAQRRAELKARSTLFGGNTATKKTQKNLLKQQYENFAASSTEVIEQITMKSASMLMSNGECMWILSLLDYFKLSIIEEVGLKGGTLLFADYKGKERFLKILEGIWFMAKQKDSIRFERPKAGGFNCHKRRTLCMGISGHPGNQDNRNKDAYTEGLLPVEENT